MNSQLDNKEKKITVYAPTNSDSSVSGAVLYVEIGIDEEVKWIWTHLENAKSAVTGYRITKKVTTSRH